MREQWNEVFSKTGMECIGIRLIQRGGKVSVKNQIPACGGSPNSMDTDVNTAKSFVMNHREEVAPPGVTTLISMYYSSIKIATVLWIHWSWKDREKHVFIDISLWIK